MPPIPIHKNDPVRPAGEAIPDTATTEPTPTRTLPPSIPAATTSSASNGPAPPQPGARPVAPTASAQTPSGSTPADPVPSYTSTHITTESRLGGPPAQFTVPPPTDTHLAGRSTTTSTTASKAGPTTLNFGPVHSQFQDEHSQGAVPTGGAGEERRSLEHPPGYRQNMDNTPQQTGLTNGPQGGSGSEESVGQAAWNLLSRAGDALKKGEEAAWRAVRDK